jgi:hypothetical protein
MRIKNMPFLQVTLTLPTTQVTLPDTRGNTKLVIVPLSVTTNPSLIFDAVPNVSIPLYSGVVFEYDAEFPIQNFKFVGGTSGDTWLLYFNGNSDLSGIHYILTQGSSVNANITNGSLNVNASGTVNANVTNSSLNTNANITNSSLNVNANITNATLNTNVTNSNINETIVAQQVAVTTYDNLLSGSVHFDISGIIMSNAGSYIALQLVLQPNDIIIIHRFSISAFTANGNILASNFYTGSSYMLPTEAEYTSLQRTSVALLANTSINVKVGGWIVTPFEQGTGGYGGLYSAFFCSTATWEGRMVIYNSTTAALTFYFGIQHSGNSTEINFNTNYDLNLDYQGLTNANSSITLITSPGSTTSGSHGGGGNIHPN